MWYLIEGHDGPDVLEARMRARAGHLERLVALRDAGRLLLAGPCPAIDAEDPGPAGFTGSAVVARFESLEAIEAGRTGSSRVAVMNDPAFDARISVYARDETGASTLLSDSVRAVLVRLLNPDADDAADDGAIPDTVGPAAVPPSLVIGNKNLLLTVEGPSAIDFERYTSLTADMLARFGPAQPGGIGVFSPSGGGGNSSTARRPPGFSTRRNSRKPASGSAKLRSP